MNLWILILIVPCFALSALTAVLGIMGRNEKNIGKSVGILKKVKRWQNTHDRGYRVVPHSTEYAYEYTVGEKKYTISYYKETKLRNIPERCAVYYHKYFPRFAEIGEYSNYRPWLVSIAFLSMTAVWVWCSFLVP